jgi:prepilin-type N-terminal cleavage/methylation domain-containing protein
MKTNKKTVNTNKKGFTLIEILIIIAIISILVTVVLVSMISSRERAQDNSAFTTFKSIASPAFMCLTSGSNLNTPDSLPALPVSICDAEPDSYWPEFAKTGWTYDDENFHWCYATYAEETVPSSCGVYKSETGCGGISALGNFCFVMKKDSKYMWCTLEGCRKEGF